MRRFNIILLVLALAVFAVCAEPVDRQVITATQGTNLTATIVATNSTIRGPIEEILIDVPSATGTTGVVSVVSREITTGYILILATNAAATGDLIFRPRVDATDNTGSALTGDPPSRYIIAGEDVIFTVKPIGTSSNVTWRAIVKYAK